jgi:hypothetical protein
MLPENVFRFVSVRPPQTREPDDLRSIEEHTASLEIVAAVERERSQNDKSGAEARRSVGDKIIASSYYFRNHPGWLKFRRGWAEFTRLISNLSDISEVDGFIFEAQRLLGELYGGNVELGTWLESDEFRELKRTLWKSYYANVLSPWRSPSDREEMVFWIRLFRLFDMAMDGQDGYAGFAAILPKSRPTVPAVLFRPDPEPPEIESPQPASRLDERIQFLEEEINKLETTRNQVNILYQKKLARSISESNQIETTQATSAAQLSDTAQEQETDKMKDQPEIINGADMTDLPWRLSAKEMGEYSGLNAVLESIGLVPEITLVPEAIAKIDEAIAKAIAELVALQQRSEIVSLGSTLAKVRRQSRARR